MELKELVNVSSEKVYLEEDLFNNLFEEVYRITPKYCSPCVQSFLKGKELGEFLYINPYTNKEIKIIKH